MLQRFRLFKTRHTTNFHFNTLSCNFELPKQLVDETNTYDFRAVVEAIESGKNVEVALAKMRADLDEIVKEKGFPFQCLLNAYETYNSKYDQGEIDQCKLFSIKVIGYLQRLSPAWLKKAFATGLYGITLRRQAYRDSFILQSHESIDPARAVPNKGLGFDFCVNVFGISAPLAAGRGDGLAGGRRLLKICLQQQSSVNLYCDTPERKTGPCVIV